MIINVVERRVGRSWLILGLFEVNSVQTFHLYIRKLTVSALQNPADLLCIGKRQCHLMITVLWTEIRTQELVNTKQECLPLEEVIVIYFGWETDVRIAKIEPSECLSETLHLAFKMLYPGCPQFGAQLHLHRHNPTWKTDRHLAKNPRIVWNTMNPCPHILFL